MSFNERYAKEEKSEKGFKPPSGVQSAAKHALELIEAGKAGDGFTSVGRGRAHQLAAGETLSLSTVKRMHSYFSRHRVDKKGKDWDNNSPGKVAWLAWGGDAGASWAAGIVKKHGGGEKEASAAEALGLLTPAAIVAQPFIMDKINKHNEKKRKQEDQDALDQEPLEESPFGTFKAEKKSSFDERYAIQKTANQYIKKQGDQWVILQKGTGKILSRHASEEKAKESFAAMMANKHGNVNYDDSDWRNDYFNLDSDW